MGRQVFQGTHGKYYVVDGVKYDIHFPVAWATDHWNYEASRDYELFDNDEDYAKLTGPLHCNNCQHYASFRGVVVAYCSNCVYAYGGLRGSISHVHGSMRSSCMVCTTSNAFCEMCHPWMAGVSPTEVGDESEEDLFDTL